MDVLCFETLRIEWKHLSRKLDLVDGRGMNSLGSGSFDGSPQDGIECPMIADVADIGVYRDHANPSLAIELKLEMSLFCFGRFELLNSVGCIDCHLLLISQKRLLQYRHRP